MTTEIERKFILDEVPDASRLGVGQRLRQGYLAVDGDVSLRVRIADGGATLTVKAGVGLSRTEVELPLSTEHAEALWPHTLGRRIVKVRYRVPLDWSDVAVAAVGAVAEVGEVAEVDVYDDALGGLSTVEVEFDSEADAAAFEPPRWFGREVTGDRAWTNASLARHGRPSG